MTSYDFKRDMAALLDKTEKLVLARYETVSEILLLIEMMKQALNEISDEDYSSR